MSDYLTILIEHWKNMESLTKISVTELPFQC